MATLTKPRKEYKIRYDEYGDVILPRGAEYVDGRIVFKRRNRGSAVSEISNWVANQVLIRLSQFIDGQKSGVVFRGAEEQGYQCFPGRPGQIRKPDVSYLRRDMRDFFLREHGWTLEVPELIVEVLSPGDKVSDLNARLNDFRTAGTKLMWVIDPLQRSAEVVHVDGIKWPIREDGFLDGEDVLPGFKLPLVSIFPPKSTGS